ISGALRVDRERPAVAGFVAAARLPLATLTGGALAGTGNAFVALDAAPGGPGELPHVRAIVQAWGDAAGLRGAHAIVALVSAGDGVRATLGASDADGLAAAGDVAATRVGGATTLARSLLLVSASGSAHGTLAARIEASGPLAPAPDLAIAAHVDGQDVRIADASANELHVAGELAHVPARANGDVRVEATGLVRGSLRLARVALAARATAGATTTIAVRRYELAPTRDAAWTGAGTLAFAPGRVSVRELSIANTRVGAARLDAELAAPAELADVRAWQALSRRAIRRAHVELARVDLHELAQLVGSRADVRGILSAELRVTAGDVSGRADARGRVAASPVELGELTARLALAPAALGDVTATVDATAAEIGAARLVATLALPARPFDRAAWRALDRNAVRDASLDAHELAFDPARLARLGIAAPLTGTASFTASVSRALRGARIALDVHAVRGGRLVRAVDVHVDAEGDRAATSARLVARARGQPLVALDAHLAVGADRLLVAPGTARTAPITAHGELAATTFAALAALVAVPHVADGALAGSIDLAGTLARPTATASLVARDVRATTLAAAPTVVRRLALSASWTPEAAALAVEGDEAGGGTLRVRATGRPRWRELAATLAATTDVTIDATRFELAPLVVLVPGPASGIEGALDAKLVLHGLDPKSARLAGTLHVANARVPIAPEIGTLYRGDLAVAIAGGTATLRATGKLNRGDVTLDATAPLATDAPTGRATLVLHRVQLIGTTQPVVSATIAAQLQRTSDAWHAQLVVRDGDLHVPDAKGRALAPVGAPADMTFGPPVRPRTPASTSAGARPPPEQPVLVADITLERTKIASQEVRGDATGKLRVLVGAEHVALLGDLSLDRGDLVLFGRRYSVDHATLHFDGSADPELDVRITYDFPDVSTITEVRGRASKPELHLTSMPATYSQAELLGFLLGGEPNGDPNQASSQQQNVAGVAGSLLAGELGGLVKKALPVDVDVLRYQAATATSSAAVEVGRWITHELFVAWRQRLEARPDENSGEGEIEYWLARRLSISGTVGDRGYDGVDLLWRRRW
ncbi:MAG TPA: translocation/assembly module TamB domain-containing protein, partial [Kofleriaceae bacterium]|nr:translocation/assembly module TamB domain-containing protein [Kofleriaceae bacterium]